MGQAEIIEFLEKEFYRDPNRTFTKKEIEKGINKKINDYCLFSLTKNKEIVRECKYVKTQKSKYREFRYKYLPHDEVLIKNL